MENPAIHDSNLALFLQGLNNLSPSDILGDDTARTCFQQFLGRDTPETCWQLLPEIHKPFFASASKSCAPNSGGNQRNPPAPDPDDAVAQYFKNIIRDDPKRVKRLVRVVRALREAQHLSGDALRELWLGKGGIFEQQAPTRECVLYNGRRKVGQGSVQYSLADRLTLLYVAAEVDSPQLNEKSKLSSGRGSATIGCERVAQRACVTVDTVRHDVKRSKYYSELLKIAGPGSLVDLGQDVTHIWEKEMTLSDVRLVVDYRNTHLKGIAERAEKLHIEASTAILQGLIAYGWGWDEILQANAPPLVTEVNLHLQKIGFSLQWIYGSKRRKRNSSDLQCAKRNCIRAGDNGNIPSLQSYSQAKRSFNQVQEAGNSVLGTPVPDQCLTTNVGVDPYVDEGLRMADSLNNWMPNNVGVDPYVDEGLRVADSLNNWMPNNVGVDPYVDEGLRMADSLNNWMPNNVGVDPYVDEGIRMANSLDLGTFESLPNMSQYFQHQDSSFPQQSLMALNGAESLKNMSRLT